MQGAAQLFNPESFFSGDPFPVDTLSNDAQTLKDLFSFYKACKAELSRLNLEVNQMLWASLIVV